MVPMHSLFRAAAKILSRMRRFAVPALVAAFAAFFPVNSEAAAPRHAHHATPITCDGELSFSKADPNAIPVTCTHSNGMRENLGLFDSTGLRIRAPDSAARADGGPVIRQFHLTSDGLFQSARVSHLSGGVRAKVAVHRANTPEGLRTTASFVYYVPPHSSLGGLSEADLKARILPEVAGELRRERMALNNEHGLSSPPDPWNSMFVHVVHERPHHASSAPRPVSHVHAIHKQKHHAPPAQMEASFTPPHPHKKPSVPGVSRLSFLELGPAALAGSVVVGAANASPLSIVASLPRHSVIVMASSLPFAPRIGTQEALWREGSSVSDPPVLKSAVYVQPEDQAATPPPLTDLWQKTQRSLFTRAINEEAPVLATVACAGLVLVGLLASVQMTPVRNFRRWVVGKYRPKSMQAV